MRMLKARKQDKSLKIRTRFVSAYDLVNYCYNISNQEEMLAYVYAGREEELQYGKILGIPPARLLISYFIARKMKEKSRYYKRLVIKQLKIIEKCFNGRSCIIPFPIGRKIKNRRERFHILVSREMGNILIKMMK